MALKGHASRFVQADLLRVKVDLRLDDQEFFLSFICKLIGFKLQSSNACKCSLIILGMQC